VTLVEPYAVTSQSSSAPTGRLPGSLIPVNVTEKASPTESTVIGVASAIGLSAQTEMSAAAAKYVMILDIRRPHRSKPSAAARST
jgi:hypothetical protein